MATVKRIVLMLGLAGKYDRGVARGVASYARPGRPWMFEFMRPDVASIAAIKQWRPDGIIASLLTQPLADAIASLRRPTVNVADPVTVRGVPHVNSDHYAIGAAAADHLLDRGFRQFAFVGWPGHAYSDQRERGFLETVDARGHQCQLSRQGVLLARGASVRRQSTSSALRKWLQSLPKPIGVMACNDYFGWRTAQACHLAGLRIPEDVALIGADNDEVWCSLAYPPLSSVVTSAEQIGARAAALLDRLLKKRPPRAKSILLPPAGIVTRASSDVLAIDDRDLVVALRFIRENASRPIDVDDVVAATTLTRRSLERRCRSALGRSPAEEIRRARLERACSLLVETDLPMPAIARQSGFPDGNRLYAVFTREMGMTPSAYRKNHRRR